MSEKPEIVITPEMLEAVENAIEDHCGDYTNIEAVARIALEIGLSAAGFHVVVKQFGRTVA